MKRKMGEGKKNSLRYFQALKMTQILTVIFGTLVKQQRQPLQHNIHQLPACLLVDRRDLKIWYHYKTVDRRICVANFLELPDEKGSLTEGKGRTTFSTSGSMGVPSEAWCSRWVHTETLPTVAEHMVSSRRVLRKEQE